MTMLLRGSKENHTSVSVGPQTEAPVELDSKVAIRPAKAISRRA